MLCPMIFGRLAGLGYCSGPVSTKLLILLIFVDRVLMVGSSWS